MDKLQLLGALTLISARTCLYPWSTTYINKQSGRVLTLYFKDYISALYHNLDDEKADVRETFRHPSRERVVMGWNAETGQYETALADYMFESFDKSILPPWARTPELPDIDVTR